MTVDIKFKRINIGVFTPGKGGVFNGQNALYGWTGHVKQSWGLAAAGFFNSHSDSVDIVIDRDVIDSPFFEGDRTITAGNFVGDPQWQQGGKGRQKGYHKS